MKRILTSLLLVASVYSFAQVSISGKADDAPRATLDVKAINGKANGILVPRVTRQEARDMPNPDNASEIEESTLIYVTEAGTGDRTGKAANIDEKGFYYFKDGAWVKLGGGSTQTWGEFRMTSNEVVTLTSGGASIPPTAFFVIAEINGNVDIKLPDATNLSDGKMLTVYKGGSSGNLSVQDKDGKVGGAAGSQLVGDGGIRVNFGKTFIVAGKKWYPTTF